jgi:DNA repair protein RadD
MLRDYQTRAITQLYDWFRTNPGNPCLVLPTGAGKSHIVAALCKDAVQNYPSTRILMLTHVKELIEQNAQKMRQHWANAPMGIYSASIGKKQIDAITFAGIQSIRSKAQQLGHIDSVYH